MDKDKIVKKGQAPKKLNNTNLKVVKNKKVVKNPNTISARHTKEELVKMNTLKRNKKRKRVIRIIVLFLILAIISACIALLLTLSNFDIKEIVISGNEKYTSEEIIGASNVNYGSNVFLQLFKDNKNNIKQLPYIENVNVSIGFPNKIKISVTERTPKYFAFDKEKNKFYRLDLYGHILEESDINTKTKDEILTFGISFDEEVIVATSINEIDQGKLQSFEVIQEEYKKVGIVGNITKVNFENSLTTLTINDKLNVVFPNETNLKYNMIFLKEIMQNIAQDAVGIIDMTKSKPIFSNY